jgi:hypothetical protein
MALPAVQNMLTPSELEATLQRRREIDTLMEQAAVVGRAGDTPTMRSLYILAALRGDALARDWCMAHQAHPDEEVPLLKGEEETRFALGLMALCFLIGSAAIFFLHYSPVYFGLGLISTIGFAWSWMSKAAYCEEITDLCHYARRLPKDPESIAKLTERSQSAKLRLDQSLMERQRQQAEQAQGHNLHGGSRAASASEAAAAARGNDRGAPQRMFDN